MKVLLCALLVLALSAPKITATDWRPAGGRPQIRIWPGEAPDARQISGPETTSVENDMPVAGRPWIAVGRVSVPTVTLYSPESGSTGIAVIVFPGGGYNELAIDLEGTEVCEWLAAHGITGILLKYRVPGADGYRDTGYRKSGPYPRSHPALQDAQRAISFVRAHAADWHLDPSKIGVIGFSAGGHLVAAVSTLFGTRDYEPIDSMDNESCRPDFGAAIYPGHLWNWDYRTNPEFVLNPSVPVGPSTPPTFLVHAEDDPVDDVSHSLVYYRELKKAGVPVEMHLYASGGHAFGLRPTEKPITGWPILFLQWIQTIGINGRKTGEPPPAGAAP